MVADTKQVQTLVNIAGAAAERIRAEMQVIKDTRALFQSADPDITGTPLEGNLTTVNNAIDALDTEVSKPVWTGLIDAQVPSHRNKAFD